MALSDVAGRLLTNAALMSSAEATEIVNAINTATTLGSATPGTTSAGKAVVTGPTNAIVFAPPTTPAAVATSPATAGPTVITVTGGVGGGTTIATTGVGGVGGGYSMTLGAGGVASAAATAATGGAGGAFAVTTGAGGAEAVAGVASTGGAGGAVAFVTGAGGAVSAAVSGTATGGASGAISQLTGTGGAVTATTGTNVGGASGTVTIGSGTGGAASGATDTGGASGAVLIKSGTGGAGDTGGASGAVTIQTGAAGAGGSPAVGVININPGEVNKWVFDATGNFYSTASVANVTADGAIVATGGIAFTDVLAAWIDDATHGASSTQMFIGNSTIDVTAPSDARLKMNIKPTKVQALDLLSKIEMVDFNWKDPASGLALQFGVVAQQVREVIPQIVSEDELGGVMRVRKSELTYYLLKAVQELRAEVAELKKKPK